MNKIETFITYFEDEENFEKNKSIIIQEIKENPAILKEKSQDGWTLFYLSNYYQKNDIFKECVQALNKDFDLVAQNHKLIYSSISYDRDSLNFLDLMKTEVFQRIDWNEKINEESHVSKLFIMLEPVYQNLKKNNSIEFENLQNALIDLVQYHVPSDIKEQNMHGNNLLKMMALYNDEKIWDALIKKNPDYFSNYFSNIKVPNTFIDSVIFNGAHVIFKKIKDDVFQNMNASDLDIMFDYTLKNSKEEADLFLMQDVIDEIDILSQKQITQIIHNVAQVSDDPVQKKASTDLLEYLIRIQVPFEKMTDEFGKNILFLCIDNDNVHVFEKILDKYPHIINKVDGNNETPIYYAISKRRKEHVTALLNKGAQIDVFNKEFETPLLKAVKQNMFDIMVEILKYYPDVQAANINGETPLSESIKKGAYGISYVSKLVWSGANITRNPVIYQEEESVQQIGEHGNLQVMKFSTEKSFSSFRDLMHYGLNLFEKNEFNDTLLTHSIKEGFLENTKALLVCRENINDFDGDNNSVLMLSAKSSKDDYFNSLMLTHKESVYKTVNHINDQNKSVFDILIQHAEHINARKKMTDLLDYDEEKNISIENSIKSVIYLSKFYTIVDGQKSCGLESQLKKYGKRFNLKNLKEFNDDFGNDFTKLVSIKVPNIDNFKICLDLFGTSVIENKNYKGFSTFDMINSFPDEIKSEFINLIQVYQNEKKKSINNKIIHMKTKYLEDNVSDYGVNL